MQAVVLKVNRKCIVALECLPPVTHLLRLLQAFSLFSLIIDRLQEEVRPFVAGIMQLLPELWSDADGQPLMRIQVQALMVHTCTTSLPPRRLKSSIACS